MNLLAIDTSTDIASVALMVGDEVLSERQPGQKSQAQLLLPIIDRLLATAQLHLNQLDGIVFGRGPGSFTGLRIACSIAKGLAYAHDLQLIPVSSLSTIVHAVRMQPGFEQAAVLAVLDARMQELYWSYVPKENFMAEERVTAVSNIQVPKQECIILAGLGTDSYWDQFSQALKAQISTQIPCYPEAEAMISLALQAEIAPVSVAQAQPIYVRNQVTQGDLRG